MKTVSPKVVSLSPVKVLLIGNNPIDLSSIFNKLQAVRRRKFITEIAFDIKSVTERLMHFKPNLILIDDNLSKSELLQTVQTLSAKSKTKNIPITVLKNSNYQEALSTTAVLDYSLKNNFSVDSIYSTLLNAIKSKRTQRFLSEIHLNRKKISKRLSF